MPRKLAVIPAIILPLALASCYGDAEKIAFLSASNEERKGQIEELKKNLETTEEEIREITKQAYDLETKKRNIKLYQREEVEAIKELGDVRTYQESLSDSLRKIDIALASWREATRHSLKGFVVSSFTPTGSSALVNPVVVEVSDAGVSFKHSGGNVTVPFVNLPESLRDSFVDESLFISQTDNPDGNKP